MEAAGVFASQFVYVFLLGMQSRNVYHRAYGPSAVTSLLLGCCGLFLVRSIANTSDGVTLAAYVAAGPLAICSAIWMHPRLVRGSDARRDD